MIIGNHSIGNTHAKKFNSTKYIFMIGILFIILSLLSTSTISFSQKNKNTTKELLALKANEVKAATVSYYAIIVNDREIAYFKQEKNAQKVLDDLKAMYVPEDDNVEIVDIYFDEKVEIHKVEKSVLEEVEVKTPEEVLKYILKGTDKEKTYEVQKGESYWTLAEKFDISVKDLEKANPEIQPETLQIGQEISLIVPEPLISVCTVQNIVYEENIPFETEYEETSSLYKGEYSTKRRGQYGKQEITAELVIKDGVELGKVVLDEQILSEPVAKIIYSGTKNPPPKKGTGVFQNPLNRGRVTSRYGNRIHPVYGYSKFHSGIDIAAPYGSKIHAADGGQVIFSGWKSGYGYCVIIDHGANMTSLYAHMSSISVSRGEKIYKDQTIGRVGSTGTSTGNHVHFEIRKLGQAVNPSQYVNSL